MVHVLLIYEEPRLRIILPIEFLLVGRGHKVSIVHSFEKATTQLNAAAKVDESKREKICLLFPLTIEYDYSLWGWSVKRPNNIVGVEWSRQFLELGKVLGLDIKLYVISKARTSIFLDGDNINEKQDLVRVMGAEVCGSLQLAAEALLLKEQVSTFNVQPFPVGTRYSEALSPAAHHYTSQPLSSPSHLIRANTSTALSTASSNYIRTTGNTGQSGMIKTGLLDNSWSGMPISAPQSGYTGHADRHTHHSAIAPTPTPTPAKSAGNMWECSMCSKMNIPLAKKCAECCATNKNIPVAPIIRAASAINLTTAVQRPTTPPLAPPTPCCPSISASLAPCIAFIRHGERMDDDYPHWCATASRPQDPPLSSLGHQQALATGDWLAYWIDSKHHKTLCKQSSMLQCTKYVNVGPHGLGEPAAGGDGVEKDDKLPYMEAKQYPPHIRIVSSPTIRTVQTSHDIVNRFCAGVEARSAVGAALNTHTHPIVRMKIAVEPGLIEEAETMAGNALPTHPWVLSPADLCVASDRVEWNDHKPVREVSYKEGLVYPGRPVECDGETYDRCAVTIWRLAGARAGRDVPVSKSEETGNGDNSRQTSGRHASAYDPHTESLAVGHGPHPELTSSTEAKVSAAPAATLMHSEQQQPPTLVIVSHASTILMCVHALTGRIIDDVQSAAVTVVHYASPESGYVIGSVTTEGCHFQEIMSSQDHLGIHLRGSH